MVTEAFDIVTGGAGFIGSHICRALLEEGRSVVALDNFSTGKSKNIQGLVQKFGQQFRVLDQDIRNGDALGKAFEGAETIFHHAAQPSVQRSVENPVSANSVNVEGTLRVLVAARDAGVAKLVFASSSSVYGDSDTLPKVEEMTPNPMSPYALTKYVGEMYCKVFTQIYGLPTIALRYFNVFGPRQDPNSEYSAVIPRMVTRMLDGQRPIIYGDGEQSRDFTFVRDVVRANLMAAQSDAKGISVNIACGNRYSLNQLVKSLNQVLGSSLEAIYEPTRLGDVRHSEAGIALAEETIRFKPSTSFPEGLQRTVEWFQEKTTAESAG